MYNRYISSEFKSNHHLSAYTYESLGSNPMFLQSFDHLIQNTMVASNHASGCTRTQLKPHMDIETKFPDEQSSYGASPSTVCSTLLLSVVQDNCFSQQMRWLCSKYIGVPSQQVHYQYINQYINECD